MKHVIFTSSDARFGDFVADSWLQSLKANVDLSNVDIVILDYGFTKEQRAKLEEEKIILVSCEKNGHVCCLRFRDMAAFLRKNRYDQVLSTDGGDIIFQADLKELFERNKNDFRAVCEEINLPFDAVFIDRYFSSAYAEKMKKKIRGKKMINAGVIVAPYEKFLVLCEEIDRELVDKGMYGPDQMAINYIFYRNGFVPLEEKYNFVPTTSQTSFSIKNGVLYMGNGEKIPIVHNAGGNSLFRPIQNFGFGLDHNQLKPVTYSLVRTVTAIVHFFLRRKK